MLPFGVTIPATVPQRSDIPEGLMNYPVYGVPLSDISFGFPPAALHDIKKKKHWNTRALNSNVTGKSCFR
jgi:hypothetical protein